MTFEEATAQAQAIKRILRSTRTKRTTVRNAKVSIMKVTPRDYANLSGQELAYTAVIEYLKPMLEDLNATARYILKADLAAEARENE